MTPSRCALGPLALLLLAALLPGTTFANTCNVGYSSSCDPFEFTATSNVFFHVNRTATNANSDTFDATVVFYWGLENLTLSSRPYEISDEKPNVVALSNTFKYEDEGYYEVGYSVTFDDDNAAGCSKKTFGSTTIIKMERTPSRCKWVAETPKPTMKPTQSMGPTATPRPTDEPEETVGDPDDPTGAAGGGMGVCRFGLWIAGAVTVMGTLLL